MWLTRVLFGARHFPGRIWGGKNRKVRKVTGYMLRNRERRANLIKEVEQMIAVPYLTQEEDMGHAAESRKEKSQAAKDKKKRLRALHPHVFGLNSEHAEPGYKSFLEHLNVAKKWTPR